MEEILSSLDGLKEHLICSFCNNLVSNTYKFIACSHIFCHKHLKDKQIQSCFICHKGTIESIEPDNCTNNILKEYRALYKIFHNLNDSIEEQLLDVNTTEEVENVKISKKLKKIDIDKKVESINSEKEVKNLRVNTRSRSGNKIPDTNQRPNTSKSSIASNNSELEAAKSDRVLKSKQNINNSSNESVQKTNQSCSKDSVTETLSDKSKSSSKLRIAKSTENIITKKEQQRVKSTQASDKKDKKVNQKDNDFTKSSYKSNDSVMEISFNSNKNTIKRNKKGETSLHSACVRNKIDNVKMLLEQGISPNTKDNAGWTPLHEAVAEGNQVLVELLLNHGAYPEVPGPHYITPLHEAVRLQLTDIVELLVLAGANINARNDKGETPLSLASEDMKGTLQSLEKQCIVSQQIDVCFTDQSEENLVILPLLLKKEDVKRLQELSKKHNNLKLVTEFTRDLTHILLESKYGSGHLMQETLLGVVAGKPILSIEWLESCNEMFLADVKNFHVTNLGGYHECVHLSLINKLTLLPGLFSGCHFYIVGFNSKYEISAHLTVKKPFLIQLITEGGGIILRREPNPESIPENERLIPYHAAPGSPLEHCAHYIIYQNKPVLAYNMKHIKSLPVAWLIECVQNFKLVDP